MTSLRRPLALILAIGLALFAAFASAAEPTFPPGSRIGLVPPAGMAASQAFQDFSWQSTASELRSADWNDLLGRQGVQIEADSIREAITRALKWREDWPQLGAEARRRALQFTPQRWVRAYENLYQSRLAVT